MATYIELPLTADATALSDTGKDYLSAEIEGWESRPGNVETVLIEASGQMGAEVVDQAAAVPPIVFAYYGQWLLGIGLRQATPAVGTARFEFDSPTVIPAGSLFTVSNPDGNSYVFQTDTDLDSAASVPEVSASALESGSDANGSVGVGAMLDVIDGVDSVSLTGNASGGSDEETGDEYLDRLADALTILAPRPILPRDFATFARQIPGVGRAVAIDLYQPGTNDNVPAGTAGGPLNVEGAPVNAGAGVTPVERCVATAITAEGGGPPSQSLMHTVWLALDAAREVNFLAYVLPPVYTAIEVQATVTSYPAQNAATVKAAAEEMLRTWLNPNGWGSDEVGESQAWAANTKARIYEAVDYLNRADGVHFVETVQLRKQGDAVWSNVDIVLPGAAPLATAGAVINVTVNVP
jgi:uncharacterized phage protein gp47/JayE